jgi:CDP-diglyceride synthetase
MISTVTTVTTAATSTVATATSLVTGLGLIATITLIALLIAKELAGAASENSSAPELTLSGALDRVLNVGIIPLSMVFVSIVLVKIVNIL